MTFPILITTTHRAYRNRFQTRRLTHASPIRRMTATARANGTLTLIRGDAFNALGYAHTDGTFTTLRTSPRRAIANMIGTGENRRDLADAIRILRDHPTLSQWD